MTILVAAFWLASMIPGESGADKGMLRKRSDIEREIRKRQMSYVLSKNKPPEPKK